MQRTGHYLYRHFGEDGVLLYVGITNRWTTRLSDHKRDAHWFDTIKYVTIEQFKSRLELERAEAVAIRDEKPQCNLQRPLAQTSDDPLRFLQTRLLARPGEMMALSGSEWVSAWHVSHFFDIPQYVIRRLVREKKLSSKVSRNNSVLYVAVPDLERIVLSTPKKKPHYRPPLKGQLSMEFGALA